MRSIILSALLVASMTGAYAQEYQSPLDIPILLSGNFGELRNNHFHSGIDLKTQAVINKPVHSIADGFVSRIAISPSGYGLAIYVDHPSTGQTSVYAHINKFPANIEKYIQEEQYKQESFRVDLRPDKHKFPLKKGDLIAYSGNTGSSGGPHVHFEIRDTKSENVLDPLPYFKSRIKDDVAPDLRGVAVYPIAQKGSVNNSTNPFRRDLTKLKNGSYAALPNIEAWGTIGLGVKGYDRMTGTTNIYGVKIVRLFVDGKQIFKSDVDAYSFSQTRMLNSFVDFADWRNRKSFFMKSFVEPGNKLPFYEAVNNGYLVIDKEKVYNIKYELEDLYGNVTNYSFSITGKKQAIEPRQQCSLYMPWDEDNRFMRDDFSLVIAKGNLYDNLCFDLKQAAGANFASDIYKVNNTPVPLQNKATLRIRLTSDLLENKQQYGIVKLNNADKVSSWIGGTYLDGAVTAAINELGDQYAVFSDTTPPAITPIKKETWVSQKSINVRLTDNLSGVASFRGVIDGKFVLFTHDVKASVYTYKFDSRIESGKKHSFSFVATDGCGNQSEYTTEFTY